MAINDFTPEQQKAIDHFMPYVEQALKKINDAPGGPYHMTAFIFHDDQKNPVLIHVTNIPDNNGENLVQLHYQLSIISAVVDDAGLVERSEIKQATQTQTPEEIADKLAVALLAGGSEGISDETQALLNEYLQSRKK